MINIMDSIRIHEILIEEFGGQKGLRDRGLLDSALSRPFQTFDNKDLYPGPVEKAAALIESILQNHPFIDGNKRTGYVLMRMLLLDYELDIIASMEEKYKFVIDIATGISEFQNIVDWLIDHIKK